MVAFIREEIHSMMKTTVRNFLKMKTKTKMMRTKMEPIMAMKMKKVMEKAQKKSMRILLLLIPSCGMLVIILK
jgi:hypothetical protein